MQLNIPHLSSVLHALEASAPAPHHQHRRHHVALKLETVVFEAVDGNAPVIEQVRVVSGDVAGDEVYTHMVVIGQTLKERGVAEHERTPSLNHVPVVAHLLTRIAERVTAAVTRQGLVVVGGDGGRGCRSSGLGRFCGFYRTNWSNWSYRSNRGREGFLTAAFAGPGVDPLAAVDDGLGEEKAHHRGGVEVDGHGVGILIVADGLGETGLTAGVEV